MQNYKEVCGNEKEIWFQIQEKERANFLEWAKNLGCVWINGKIINPNAELSPSFFYAISNTGKLSRIPCFAWFSKNGQFDRVKRFSFSEFIKSTIL